MAEARSKPLGACSTSQSFHSDALEMLKMRFLSQGTPLLVLALSGCGFLHSVASLNTQLQGKGPIVAQLPRHSDFTMGSQEAVVFFELKGATQATFREVVNNRVFNVLSADPVVVSGPGITRPVPLTKLDRLYCLKIRAGEYQIESLSVGDSWNIIPRLRFHATPGEISYIGTILVGPQVPNGTFTSVAVIDNSSSALTRLHSTYPKARRLGVKSALAKSM